MQHQPVVEMYPAGLFHDPLSFNLNRRTADLLSSIPRSAVDYDCIVNASSTSNLLSAISSALANPCLTTIVAKIFRPLLMDLCSQWIDDSKNSGNHLVALSYLVEVHEELFPILHRVLIKHFEGGPLAFLSSVPSLASVDIVHFHQLLLAYYRILQINRELPQHLLWPLAPLSILIESDLDHGIQFLAIRCYSLQSGMGEAERIEIERRIIGELFMNDFSIIFGQNLDGTTKQVDGWMLPVVELRRIREEREEMVTLVDDFYSQEQANEVASIQDSDLSPWVTNVCGVLLLRSSVLSPPIPSFVPIPSSMEALQQLALHVSLRLPTILTSVPSGGKALILSHIAGLVHPGHSNQIVTIQLADTSLDPRSLLGSYVSSTVHPGTFEWRDGTLIRCMREGKWVVFKDIDRGSPEILGVIKPLAESLELGKWVGGRAKLDVPSHGTVVAHDSFRLFSTRSSLPSKDGVFSSLTFFGSHRFSEVSFRTPSTSELNSVVSAKFPRLAGNPAQVIIQVWQGIRQMGPSAAGREVGLKELLKFCRRIDALLLPSDILTEARMLTLADMFPNPSIREDIFMEARDIFFGFGMPTPASRAHCDAVAGFVGQHLGLDLERQLWILNGKLPQLEIEKDSNGRTTAVRAGRTCILKSLDKSTNSPHTTRPFTMHKPAVCLISRIATAVSHSEPILLTGETGTGKTSVITHLASLLHQRLISLNLSHQTESSDLIGGLKPIDARIPAAILQEKFVNIFAATFSRRKNEKFETEIRKAVNDCKWKRAVGLWKESVRLAVERIQARESPNSQMLDDNNPRKRRKTAEGFRTSAVSWTDFLHEVEEFEARHVLGKGKFTFGFVEGPLIQALRSGYWVLLDEINLAAPETLESISSLLQDPTASITLTEHGSLVPVPRHPNFRIFACMNPATDVGKKDLPPVIRSRFTEINVQPPDADKDTLLSIISQYIGHAASADKKIIMDVAEFYIAVKQVAESRQIADGANHRPHFSMRTLTRALTFASDTVSTFSLRRSVWEGCLMAFTMSLDMQSAELVTNLAKKHLLSSVRNAQSMLVKEPAAPARGAFIKFGPFYLERGLVEPDSADDYIITPSVAQKLCDISRIILTRRFPVLIEGPTSSGKTSSIEYLARRTGHKFVRINNHEHTDIQEYVGCYVSDPVTGKLVYKDGLLLQALRFGHWIVLDELNLAPTDVLEALNRLLDDNRELVVPETQEVVRPHPHFMLFATQNPPGLYAGRKILSRAFRSRFLEVHFNDVPQDELETILCQKCRIAPSYSKRIINVFRELQKRRQTGRVFESKHGFATLRDLFRWGNRGAVGYQELADNGYMLLAERTRRAEDKAVVKEVLENEMGVKINEEALYDLQRTDPDSLLGCPIPRSVNVVWTKALQRLYTLVCRALKFQEPVLLVGETGTGKTSICQIIAEASSQPLLTLNCHQNLETADIIGGMRPVRNRSALQADAIRNATVVLKDTGLEPSELDVESLITILYSASKSEGHGSDPQVRHRLQSAYERLSRSNSIFEWRDGPLIDAMRNGGVFLMDEISLADDSILERLNSVLEHGRSIVLAERGGADSDNTTIQADENFRLVATMNPGGDYGKKELSLALRNRFTEIWVPPIDDRPDLELVVNSCWTHPSLRIYTLPLLDFIDWLCLRVGDRSLLGLRDILAWVGFVNIVYEPDESETHTHLSDQIFHHGANMTYLDGLGSFPQLASFSRQATSQVKSDALRKLQDLVPLSRSLETTVLITSDAYLQIGPFSIPKGSLPLSQQSFNFAAPTTLRNALRVIRACQVTKPILLEGSPGVGKTSLVIALANLSGHNLCRINLSDQTDLSDLFGSDLPVEGGVAGEFAWKDAEFLKALQEGSWVLLDEMNLASQAVLEGLNAVLDHRGTVYIPELKRSFRRHPSFRIFAAQNPLHQGSGRKGLPKSFLNRFTKVYMEELTHSDFYTACSELFPRLEEDTLHSMISFNIGLSEKVSSRSGFALDGSPWEFNLRDVIRWATLVSSTSSRQPVDYLRAVYLDRLRSLADREEAIALFNKDYSLSLSPSDILRHPPWAIDPKIVQFGAFSMARQSRAFLVRPHRVLHKQLNALESLGLCVSQSWLAILTGPRGSGKTSLVRSLAHFTGNVLREMTFNPGTDTMDILGSFEQLDNRRTLLNVLDEVIAILEASICTSSGFRQACIDHHTAYSLRQDCDKVSASELPAMIQNVFNLTTRVFASCSSSRDQDGTIQDTLRRLMEAPFEAGRFAWVDGPLIHAMKHGQWILLEGANLCNPSVLDRLNSLCEHGGCLTLSERGFVGGAIQVIKPHPNFRLFMAVDPQQGELSRAMRNRGMEIFLETGYVGNDILTLQDFYRLPLCLFPHIQWERGVAFEAIRRGILFQQPLIAPATSTGRSLDQDSALAYLLDATPTLLSRRRQSDNPDSWIFFLCRSLIPAHMPCLLRYLKTIQMETTLDPIITTFLRKFPGEKLCKALMIYRQDYSLKKKISLDTILARPMNFYYDEFSPGQVGTPSSPHLAQSAVLEILNLGAALFIQGAKIAEVHNLEKLDDKRRLLTEAVEKLSVQTRSTALLLLDMLRVSTSPLDSARLASIILSNTSRLQTAIKSPSYDFSALYGISIWLRHLLGGSEPIFTDIVDCVDVLHHAVSPSNGVGLLKLWSRLFIEECPSAVLRMATWTDQVASSLDDFPGDTAIRLQLFNLMSLETFPSSLASRGCCQQSLSELRSKLNEYLNSRILGVPVDSPRNVNTQSSILELSLLSLSYQACESRNVNAVLQGLITLASNEKGSSLLRLALLQHHVWILEGGTVDQRILIRAQINWMEGLWNTRLDDNICGPSVLFRPVMLRQIFQTCNMNEVQLCNLLHYEEVIRLQARTSLIISGQPADRFTQLARVFFGALICVASSYMSSYDSDTIGGIKGITFNDGDSFLTSLLHALSLLERTADEVFAAALNSELVHLIDSQSSLSPLQLLALAWVGVGRLIFHLTVPDIPLDPMVVEHVNYSRLRGEEADISAQIHLHEELEGLVTGNTQNCTTLHLKSLLSQLQPQLANSSKVPHRQDIPRLHLFWSEIMQFKDTVLSSTKVQSLLDGLLMDRQDSVLRERVFQESLAGFFQRCDVVYPEFLDMTIIFKLAGLSLRLGVRTLLDSTSMVNSDNKTHHPLVLFPSICSSFHTIHTFGTIQPPTNTIFEHILLALAASSAELSLGASTTEILPIVETAYEQAVGLWLIDRAKETEWHKEANTLYRSGHASDTQNEEEDFLALFPTFEDAFESETITANKKYGPPASRIQPKDAISLLQIHFTLTTARGSTLPKHSFETFRKFKIETIRNLLQHSPGILSDAIDHSGRHLQLVLLYENLKKFTTSTSDHTYNFYTDANYQQLRRASSIITGLRRRLQSIANEWPDQMVLKHLVERCDLILNVNATSPLAKVLAMIEKLLVQTDDWEAYSNRENSIKANRDELVALLIDWRRSELACWKTLLEAQSTAFVDEMSDWWFRLYDALVRGALSASRDGTWSDGEQSYLDSLLPLLDDFMTGGPLGQFHARLQLLSSFDKYTEMIIPLKTTKDGKVLEVINKVIHATCSYYSLHSESLLTHLQEHKRALEKEVEGFIKLASWKDVNVEALRQSSKKTHQQLYKIVRKFREILRQPVRAYLQLEGGEGPLRLDAATLNRPEHHGNFQSLAPTPNLAHSQGLGAEHHGTYDKLHSLIADHIKPSIRTSPADIVDEIAVEIITTSTKMAEYVVPSSLSGKLREKHINSLQVRKRKAWSELLKELKRSGLSGNIKPEILRQNASQPWVRQQPIIPRVSAFNIDVDKGETYFNKLCGSLPILRGTLSCHHSDLGTRELQRGVTFLECGFAMAVDLRVHLCSTLEAADQMQRALRRLKALSREESFVVCVEPWLHVSSLRYLLCKIEHAILEVHDCVSLANDLGLDPPATTVLLDEILAAGELTRRMRGHLQQLLEDLGGLNLPFLLLSEYDIVAQAERHRSHAIRLVSDWLDQCPMLHFLFHPLLQWLREVVFAPLQICSSTSGSNASQVEELIDSLMVCVQSVASRCSRNDKNEESNKYLLDGYLLARDLTRLLRLGDIRDKVASAFSVVSSYADMKESLLVVTPFLNLYISLALDQISALATWTKALFKLNFVLCSLMKSLSQQGFCRPAEIDKDAGPNEEILGAAEGTGIGDGSGGESISKEIEDESQIEGLQDTAREGDTEKKNEADADAIEMTDDFGGELEDMPEVDDDDDRSSSEESEFDETLGDLDVRDQSTINEKIRHDSHPPADSDGQEERMDENHSTKQKESSEMISKESENARKLEDSGEVKQGEEDLMKDKINPQDEQNSDPFADGAPMEQVPEANSLDLPDNINLDDKDEKEGEHDVQEDYEISEDQNIDPEDTVAEDVDDRLSSSSGPENDFDAETPGSTQPEPGEAGYGENKIQDTHPDVSSGGEKPDSIDVLNSESKLPGSSVDSGNSRNEGDDKISTQEEEDYEVIRSSDVSEIQQPSNAPPAGNTGPGNVASGVERGQVPSGMDERPMTNPLRSLGDALNEIRRRFDEIFEASLDENPRQQVGEPSKRTQVEYLRPEDTDHEMQALGPAGDEQVAQLNELRLVDDEMEIDQESAAMPVDEVDFTPGLQESAEGQNQEDLENPPTLGQLGRAMLPLSHQGDEESNGIISGEGKASEDEAMEGIERELELELQFWRNVGYPEEIAQRIWQRYEALTHDLAYALCEQLRLILEPTLATRLKGDYRSGKRLNMKKVIAYIASDYTKDKIWLRRTKPSQREYQVLISLDDSRSMSDSHCIHLAFQTLALISKALSRLESGDIAIAKFGETVEILRGLDEGPFTEKVGTDVIDAFRFTQKATNVLMLMEKTLIFLESARERKAMTSASATELWQLQIIISDGVCQDHDKLHAVLRKAEEQRVMVVFIILDSMTSPSTERVQKNPQSILEMKKVDFKMVEGRMELHHEKYLDSFPFGYYVVLRNVESLPDVLGETLKQFFEKLSER